MSKPSKGRKITVPIHGKAAHNTGFLLAIGGLVVNWANNESVFNAILQCLIKGEGLTASIVWYSQRTTRARLDLLSRLIRERIKDAKLAEDLEKAISQFHGFSRVRNFYCHAAYGYDTDLCMRDATSVTVVNEGFPIAFERKPMDANTFNEITDTSIKLTEFNAVLWKLVRRVEAALGVQRTTPDGVPHDNPIRGEPPPPKGEAATRG